MDLVDPGACRAACRAACASPARSLHALAQMPSQRDRGGRAVPG